MRQDPIRSKRHQCRRTSLCLQTAGKKECQKKKTTKKEEGVDSPIKQQLLPLPGQLAVRLLLRGER